MRKALVEIGQRLSVGRVADLDPYQPSGSVVDRRVYAAPDSRQGALFRRITIGRPLQRHIDARALLEDQVLVRLDLELAHTAGKSSRHRSAQSAPRLRL